MRNLLFKIAYRGTNYHGWQVQKNALAIQEVVQNAIEKVFMKREDIVGCSRTDAGVHANAYYFHMQTEHGIPVERVSLALNHFLPNDICVLHCEEVPMDFHARYHVRSKEYIYKIWASPVRNPFLEDMAYHYPYALRLEEMKNAAHSFIGTHDFAAFCASGSDLADTIRTVHYADINEAKDLVVFRVCGDGFLYNMVRIMVGTLLSVSQGRLGMEDIPCILQSKDRSKAGKTISPKGLYLNAVNY